MNSATVSPTTALNSRRKLYFENGAACAISSIDGLSVKFSLMKSIARQMRRPYSAMVSSCEVMVIHDKKPAPFENAGE
ncbi:MAG: hypothetical protein CMJ78_21295 [Planctomycetaceae bacterium]|nr:hypothetical protein [Planctomycetaceae bacterium]